MAEGQLGAFLDPNQKTVNEYWNTSIEKWLARSTCLKDPLSVCFTRKLLKEDLRSTSWLGTQVRS